MPGLAWPGLSQHTASYVTATQSLCVLLARCHGHASNGLSNGLSNGSDELQSLAPRAYTSVQQQRCLGESGMVHWSTAPHCPI